MTDQTIQFRRSAVWDVKLKFHPAVRNLNDERSPILTLTVTADNYEDAIDGAIWAAINDKNGKRVGAVEEDYEIFEVVRIRGCTVV